MNSYDRDKLYKQVWEMPVDLRTMESLFAKHSSKPFNPKLAHGPNRITALPMEVPVCYQEIAHCIEKTISKIETAVLAALEETPPELYADIVKNGIYLTGGGALLRGLDKRLTDKINIPFHIAEDPLHSVALGTGVALKNLHKFHFFK